MGGTVEQAWNNISERGSDPELIEKCSKGRENAGNHVPGGNEQITIRH